MYRHLDDELRELREAILEMGGRVERQIADAMKALVGPDPELAEEVMRRDHAIDEMERSIDEKCLRILALYQPAASDLRFVALGFKIVTDLERQGDQALNIAERAIELSREPRLKPYIDLPRMAEIAGKMLGSALDAFVRKDAAAARAILPMDTAVDDLFLQLFRELITYMIEDPRTIRKATRLIFVAKYLERIADHATNIAEMVIFNVEGRDVRHGHDKEEASG